MTLFYDHLIFKVKAGAIIIEVNVQQCGQVPADETAFALWLIH